MSSAITTFEIPSLTKLASGKVRELISAYDVIMGNGIPSKGQLLTLISTFWFKLLPTLLPDTPLQTHFLTLSLPSSIPQSLHPTLQNRSMVVRRLKIFPLEAIVRGYLSGSAWKEYQKSFTLHTIPLPSGLLQSQALPTGPLYTPSTKAEAGANDENISPAQAAEIVGPKYAERIEKLALSLYTAARDYALTKGIIIADTKFEFGLDEETDEIVVVDEVLTPDSSRFWPADKYEVGREQESFDKQYLRNWLVQEGLKGKEGVSMPEEVVRGTAERYREAFEKLTGRGWETTLHLNGEFEIHSHA
ncbi:putative Phosphoribosylaminoimidazole-succinocarboxamide synthase [Glarea lozoyensis 74030]|uniref:Phosphoribosylaminoimidazole-succinocarboxamide synthase n=1 Tax=Glarea lozoyensis (strain ATCC 74030 / MF5533) TaxID=1104152 RepID=H0EVD8_GLAL7|nr:putative Phosphoribosylaminoimidazole-succinocarboxamide synthase [Glarea lozoyensis 74030]